MCGWQRLVSNVQHNSWHGSGLHGIMNTINYKLLGITGANNHLLTNIIGTSLIFVIIINLSCSPKSLYCCYAVAQGSTRTAMSFHCMAAMQLPKEALEINELCMAAVQVPKEAQ